MNIKAIKRSQVTITGTIDGVYKARQQLIGNLPVALIFDFPDSNNDASDIISLSTKYGVFITLRQKQRQSTLAVVIKGIEKYIGKFSLVWQWNEWKSKSNQAFIVFICVL